MGRFKMWLADRRLKKQIKILRKKQLKTVEKTMKRIYNPIYFNVRPRYKSKIDTNEIISVYDAVNDIYTGKRADETIVDIEKSQNAET